MRVLKYAILGLLNQKSMSGYELSSEFESALNEFWNAKHSQIYPELRKLTEEKKIAPFKLTYTNDGGLYIAVGYGEQPSGGYSIAVNELYLTENAIVIDTELKGPESAEESGAEKSYPYVVVQTEYLEQPIIFQ